MGSILSKGSAISFWYSVFFVVSQKDSRSTARFFEIIVGELIVEQQGLRAPTAIGDWVVG